LISLPNPDSTGNGLPNTEKKLLKLEERKPRSSQWRWRRMSQKNSQAKRLYLEVYEQSGADGWIFQPGIVTFG
jgi:hypothetical protein